MLSDNQFRLNQNLRGLPLLQRPAPLSEAFVVAGGPSLRHQDLSRLPPERTIAVNRAFEIVQSRYCYLMDDRLVDWILADQFRSRDAFLRGSLIRVQPSPLSPRTPEQLRYPVAYVPRQLEEHVALPRLPGIWCGCNSGFGAIQLAVWMGATRIYLLGFDMHARNGTHFHGGYSTTAEEQYHKKLEMFRAELERFTPLFAASGVEVVNLTPGSALTCFKMGSLEEAASVPPAGPVLHSTGY